MSDNKTTIKNIEIGKFYLIHYGSKTGHPGFVVWKDDSANLYLLIKFGSVQNKDNMIFPYQLSNDVNKNLIYKRPYLAKRKNIGKEWVFDFCLSNDSREVFNQVLKNKPVFSKDINRKDRRFFALAIKKGKIKTVI